MYSWRWGPVIRERRGSLRFFWMQSMIRNDGQRALLFELDTAIQTLARQNPGHDASLPLTGVYHNLLRQWAEM